MRDPLPRPAGDHKVVRITVLEAFPILGQAPTGSIVGTQYDRTRATPRAPRPWRCLRTRVRGLGSSASLRSRRRGSERKWTIASWPVFVLKSASPNGLPGPGTTASCCGKTSRTGVAPCGWRIIISATIPQSSLPCFDSAMRKLVVLFSCPLPETRTLALLGVAESLSGTED